MKQLCPSIGRLQIETEFQLVFDQRPKLIKPRMLISEVINLRPGIMKLLRSMQLMQRAFQPRNFPVQCADLLLS